MAQLIITATGPDRTGIVSDISKIITEKGGNIEESRMTQLAGDFAVIMLVTFDLHIDELENQLSTLSTLQITIKNATEKQSDDSRQTRQIVLNGADNEGIVHSVTEFLSKNNINIESMDTESVQAPISGTTLFCMQSIIQVPRDVEVHQLENDLAELGENLGVDLELNLVL